jgi:hypothetical protein
LSYLDDVAPTSHRIAMAFLSLLFGLELVSGVLFLTISECAVSEPGGSVHMTSCGREHPLEPLIFLAVAVALYAGSRWLATRDRTAGLMAFAALVVGPPLVVFIL